VGDSFIEHRSYEKTIDGRRGQLTEQVVHDRRSDGFDVRQILHVVRRMREHSRFRLASKTPVVQGARKRRVERRRHEQLDGPDICELEQRLGDRQRVGFSRNGFQRGVNPLNRLALAHVAAGHFVQLRAGRQFAVADAEVLRQLLRQVRVEQRLAGGFGDGEQVLANDGYNLALVYELNQLVPEDLRIDHVSRGPSSAARRFYSESPRALIS
jgi:hypothetical protein